MESLLGVKKKGQMSIGNAPTIVLIIGLTFLVMATFAFVGEKYSESMPDIDAKTIVNESMTFVTNPDTICVATSGLCNFGGFSINGFTNASTGKVMPTTNYSSTAAGCITQNFTGHYNMSYSMTYSGGAACNITRDLETELGNNTSIAGIVLTISLVGIILTLLIGVFLGIRGVRTNRV